MATLPDDLTIDDLRTFVRKNTLVIRETKARDRLKDKIKKAFDGVLKIGKPVVYDDVEVKFEKQDRFDAEKFAKRHPADRFPQFYVQTLDVAKVPETLKTPTYFKRSVVLHASLVEVADVTLSDIAQEPAGMPAEAEAVSA